MLKKVPGTRDILPDEIANWQKIEEISRRVFNLFNYKEIRPPLIEEAGLFNRSLGESSEIVQKQMFLIKNGDDTYALRPEGTVSIARAYIENELARTSGFNKFYYMGPMFRLERPQKGRLRQFHHIGVEAIGSADPYLDIDVVFLADSLLKAFGIDGYQININSLGCLKDKEGLAKNLREQLTSKSGALCSDCQVRLGRNVLRILDCKNDGCQNVIQDLNLGNSYLCPECYGHFDTVKSGLDSLKINYTVCPRLVRGLDYYTRTVFEITHSGLGAQNAVGAGGRYDNLLAELGGPDLGAIGFAFGVERLLLAREPRTENREPKLVYLITLGEAAKRQGLQILNQLRANGIACETDYEMKSLKGAMRRANDLSAKHALIIGDNEIKNNAVMLKDMGSGEQREIERENLIKELTTEISVERRADSV